MKILRYNKFNFINENSEFSMLQGQTFSRDQLTSYDPNISTNGGSFVDFNDTYSNMRAMVNNAYAISKQISAEFKNGYGGYDAFLDDLEEYNNFKILRIIPNTILNLDVFISFNFYGEEFFGVYRNFNSDTKPKLSSDLLSDPRFTQINHDYYIKLNNYIYRILVNWFEPKKGEYLTLKDGLKVTDSLGNYVKIPKNTQIVVKDTDIDHNHDCYITIMYKDKLYNIFKNDYYFFKYRTELIA